MTPARALFIAMVAAAVLVAARPIAGGEQFPRGLMAGTQPSAAQFCTIDTRPLSFGAYDSLAGTPLDAIGQIIYVCGKATGERASEDKAIRIEMAQGYSASFATRAMVGPGTESLLYNIYLDATHRNVWGTGEGTTQYYYDAHPPNRTPVTVPAFGRIDAMQDVPAGPYQDVVGVRILF